jgi:hypothetical protein
MRYCPGRAFPPYAFLPGQNPHPTRDPEGHSYGRAEAPPAALPPARWRESVDYLHGVDLYNHGFLWEAHEAWEGLWHASKPDPLQADFLQGLIQCAAACLKIPMRQPAGLERLTVLGCAKLERVARAAGERFMGLDLSDFAERMRSFAAARPVSADDRPRIVLA